MVGKRDRLVSTRKTAGFSQERLAEVVGVERSTVQRWERGETCPQPWARPKLARALGITDQSLSELLDEPAEPDNAASAFGPIADKVVSGQHTAALDDIALRYGHAERRDPLRGLSFAQAAVEHSCGVSDAVRGLSLLHVGEAYAMLGEHRQCERALGAAETAFAQIGSDDPGASFYSPTQLGRLTGSCYLFLGHPERAEPFLEATAQALRTRHKTRSLVLGNLHGRAQAGRPVAVLPA